MSDELSVLKPKNCASGGGGVDTAKGIARAMLKLKQYLDTHSRRLMTYHGITAPQVMCLDALREKRQLSISQISGVIHANPSTAGGVVDRLERKNLVKRLRNYTDRRLVLVKLTDQGRTFLTDSPCLLHNRLKEAMRPLTQVEQSELANMLEKLTGLLSTAT